MSARPPMRLYLRSLRAAFVFLTRLPVGGFPFTPAEWRWAPAHFPLVGAMLGAALGLFDRVLAPLGDSAAAILTIAASMLATGALHEDGLADTSDALGGAHDRAKIFVILKDSRVGTFGAAALVVSIVGRAALIARLGPHASWALPVALSWARAGPVWQMALLPYVTAPEAARSLHVTGARVPQAVVATAFALATGAVAASCGAFSVSRLALLPVVCGVVTVVTAVRYVKRAGGVCGDFLGATEQLGELAAFATLAFHAS